MVPISVAVSYGAITESILRTVMSAFAQDRVEETVRGGLYGSHTLKAATKTVKPINHFDDLKFSSTGRVGRSKSSLYEYH